MNSRNRRYINKSQGDIFVAIVLGLALMVMAFGVTLAVFDALEPVSHDARLSKLTAISLADGRRLIYPLAQKSDHGPERAFDGSTDANSFWEVPGPFPIELTIELPQPAALASYTLAAGEDAGRMPSEWLVEGSQDGRSWIPLGQEQIQSPWAVGQAQSFRLRSDQSFRLFHFRFLKGFNNDLLRIYEIVLH